MGTKKGEARKLGRNDPCRCGSGKKYKHCCWQKDQDALAEAAGDRRSAELQRQLNPIENPEDDVALRTRNSYNRQMNRGELFWAALQQGGKALPNMPPDIVTAPFEKTDAFSVPPDPKAKPRSKKKK
jgi:hypothetical protein